MQPHSTPYTKHDTERKYKLIGLCISDAFLFLQANRGNMSNVYTILKNYKYYPYKFHIVKNLHPGNAECGILFCQLYFQQIHTHESFARLVISLREILSRYKIDFGPQEHLIFVERTTAMLQSWDLMFHFRKAHCLQNFEGGLIVSCRYRAGLESIV